MDMHPPTTESLETALVALEQDWARSEQALADADAQLDAEMERARAHHAVVTEGIRVQREGLEIQIQETRLALERQRAARAKAQHVIQETLGHATLSAILRARIEESCGDLDEATIEVMVAQALADLREPKASATPAAPRGSDTRPTPQASGAGAPLALQPTQPTPPSTPPSTPPAGPTEPTNLQQVVSSADATQGGTSSDGPVESPSRAAGPANPLADGATTERAPEQVAETALVLRSTPPEAPAVRGAGNGKTESTPRGKPAGAKGSAEAVGTKVLTFEEGDVLNQRPGWVGNPFKR
jgi:hypothetical protein